MVRKSVLLASFAGLAAAQSSTPITWTDSNTGAVLNTWSASGIDIGFAFPPDAQTNNANEFIGRLKCSSPNGRATGWCAIALGGTMANSLIVMAYPDGDQVLTSFRFTTSYSFPGLYTGDAKLTQISSSVTDQEYEVMFRCENCLSWNQNGKSGSIQTMSGGAQIGWALANNSPNSGSCPDTMTFGQHNVAGNFKAQWNSDAVNPDYWAWTGRISAHPTTTCGGSTTITSAVPTATSGVSVPSDTYDYIIVGGGAGGIPLADRLSEAGKRVLLIEKGPASSGRWGGTMVPKWLQGTNLTRFDVPGLSNEIWQNSAGIACADTSNMAGCVLGGGTAINAGLWWRPHSGDWDDNFPEGWKSSDVVSATEKAFGRISGTTTPSQDDIIYRSEPRNMIARALESKGWKEIDSFTQPDEKNRTWAPTPYMFSEGERNGPMGTYLVSASERSNFKLWLETSVRRVIREGGKVTGVEVEPFLPGGYSGIVKVADGGRVILSAGAFGSAKILLRSGIGPTDQLQVIKNSATDGATMISEDQWINLPVGYNVQDHTNTDIVFAHPSIIYYDFYAAFDSPVESDKDAYLNSRTGILTQSASNLGPIFFDQITASDGSVRQLQWTCRVEASGGATNGHTMTCSQYVGRGSKSTGRMTISSDLNMAVSTYPYLKDKNDFPAIVEGINRVLDALSSIENITYTRPPPGQSVEDYVNSVGADSPNRVVNHWIGTNKMGTDDGRNGGTAVVDTDTKVWGTENLFVVDASIFPGMITANPSAMIVTASERAVERILALN